MTEERKNEITEMDWKLDYGALEQDEEFVTRHESLKETLKELQGILDELLPLKKHYGDMSLPERIEFDIFLAYALNSLKWVHLRILGVDPTTHPIKDELKRTQAAMLKWQEVKDKTKRPIVDVKAVKRFIRSGLYDRYHGLDVPQNKKKKFVVDD